mgnify:CR=1 FL=1
MTKYSPDHYQKGSIEVWDFIADQQMDYFLGNVVKYVSRAGSKEGESRMDDLCKAAHYIRKAILNEANTPRPDGTSDRVPEGDEPADRIVQPDSSISPDAPDLGRVPGSFRGTL